MRRWFVAAGIIALLAASLLPQPADSQTPAPGFTGPLSVTFSNVTSLGRFIGDIHVGYTPTNYTDAGEGNTEESHFHGVDEALAGLEGQQLVYLSPLASEFAQPIDHFEDSITSGGYSPGGPISWQILAESNATIIAAYFPSWQSGAPDTTNFTGTIRCYEGTMTWDSGDGPGGTLVWEYVTDWVDPNEDDDDANGYWTLDDAGYVTVDLSADSWSMVSGQVYTLYVQMDDMPTNAWVGARDCAFYEYTDFYGDTYWSFVDGSASNYASGTQAQINLTKQDDGTVAMLLVLDSAEATTTSVAAITSEGNVNVSVDGNTAQLNISNFPRVYSTTNLQGEVFTTSGSSTTTDLNYYPMELHKSDGIEFPLESTGSELTLVGFTMNFDDTVRGHVITWGLRSMDRTTVYYEDIYDDSEGSGDENLTFIFSPPAIIPANAIYALYFDWDEEETDSKFNVYDETSDSGGGMTIYGHRWKDQLPLSRETGYIPRATFYYAYGGYHQLNVLQAGTNVTFTFDGGVTTVHSNPGLDFGGGGLTVSGPVTAEYFIATAIDLEEDLRFPATGFNPPGAADEPDLVANAGTSGNMMGVYFDYATDESLWLKVQLPHSWREGSDLEPHFHWSPTTANTGAVVWAMDYSWANINDTFPATSTILWTSHVNSASQWKHVMTDTTPAQVMDGTGKTLSSMIDVRIYRDANNGSDTYADDASLHEFDIHYNVYRMGQEAGP